MFSKFESVDWALYYTDPEKDGFGNQSQAILEIRFLFILKKNLVYTLCIFFVEF